MAVSHGSAARVYVGGYDLSGFLRSAASELTRETAETTTFGLGAKTYVAGLADATVSLEGYYDGAPDTIAPVLYAATSSERVLVTVCPQGDTVGAPAYSLESLETRYTVEASLDDVTTLAGECQSTSGRDRLRIHHPLAARTSSGSGTALDGGAATTAGGVGALQVTVLTGSVSLDVTIQDSADGTTGWTTILTYGVVTASRTARRVTITGTVRRYTRAAWTISGTGSATFWVGFGRF